MTVHREQVVQTAEKLVARGKIEAAIREYRKVLSDQPNDPTTLNRIGDLYARIERFGEAVRFFTQIAEGYTKDGFFVKAIAIYKKIIKLDPIRLEVYERLAELYHRQGLVNEARTQYQVLADYYFKHDNQASALSIYERLAQLEPQNPRPRAKLAELYQEQKLIDKAMGEYKTIAELMISHGQPEQAAQVYDRALAVSSDDLTFIGDAVTALRRAGQTGAAAKLLAAAVKRNPEAKKLALLMPRAGREPEEATAVEPAPAPAVDAGRPPARARAADAADVAGGEQAGDLASTEVGEPPPPIEIDAGGEIELDLDEVFVLDLDADEAPSSLVTPPPDMVAEGAAGDVGHGILSFEAPPELDEVGFGREAEPAAAAGGGFEIDAAFLEQTASELQPQRPRHQDDLFAEAEVLAKYSLDDKAAERLQEVLQIDPGHLDAMALLIRIDLDKGRFGRAAALANEMTRVATARDDVYARKKVRARLVAAGFELDGDFVVGVPSPAPDRAEEKIGRLIEDLLDEAPAARRPPRPARGADRVDAAMAEITSTLAAPKRRARPPASAPAPPPPPPAPPPAAATAGEEALGADDSGVAWLDDVATPAEVAPAPAGAPSPPADEVFAEEDFFDLAAELEEELSAAEEEGLALDADALEAPREQTLEEIVEGFKRGVAESLSPQDYDTHFNLGIAYREMGLLDEAIGEFQLAAKAPNRLVECCSMLGLCFQDKGLPELAIRWYRRGLDAPGLSEEESQGLLYDLGNVYLAAGDLATAYQTFVEVYGTNSNYRDVVAKLEEISSR